MGKTLQRFTVNLAGTVRREMLEGREHIVGPAAMLAEGVWTGSNGPLFYREKQLVRSIPSWNHKPVVVNHPKNKEGEMISACLPDVLNNRKIGIILNTDYDDKLRTEVWIDVLKANQVDKRIVPRMERGEVIECSTGVYTNNIKKSGKFGDMDYEEEATDLAPDHLAVLPDKLGAYSVRDGGGILQVNAAGLEPESVMQILHQSAMTVLDRMGIQLRGNELSYSMISSQLCDLLRIKYGEPGRYWDGCILEVYPSQVIFAMDSPNRGMYMIGYEVNDDTVSLVGDEKEVSRVVEYEAEDGTSYAANSDGQLVLQTMEDAMSVKFDRAKHISTLIGAGWDESDRDALSKTPDAILQKMKPEKVTGNETDDETDDDGDVAIETRKTATGGLNSLEKLVQQADPETRAAFNQMRATAKREKAKVVATLAANTKDSDLTFKKKFLDEADTVLLQGIVRYGEICAEKALEEAGVESEFSANDGGNRYFGSGGFGGRPIANNRKQTANDEPDEEVLTTSSFLDDDEK